MSRFAEDCLIPAPRGKVPTTAAYSAHQDWCRANGQQSESLTDFKQGLEGFAAITRKRPQASPVGNPVAMLCGYTLSTYYDDRSGQEAEVTVTGIYGIKTPGSYTTPIITVKACSMSRRTWARS